MRAVRWTFVGLVVSVVVRGGEAQGPGVSLPVANASFELPAIPSGTFSTTSPPPGWQVFGNGINFGARTIGVLDPAGTLLYPGPVPDGENVGVVFLMDDPGNQTTFANIEAGMEQTLSVALATHTRYTLTVAVGNIANDPSPPNSQFQFAGFPGYRIELVAGGTTLVADASSLLPPEGQFLTSTRTVTIGASHPQVGALLGIRLVNLNAAPGLEVNFDDVRLEAELLPSGQANTTASSLTIDGVGAPGVPGPFQLLVGSPTLTLSWVGEPNAPVTLAVGPLNPGGAFVPGLGSVDVGTPPLFADLGFLTTGIGSPTNASGGASEVISLPPGISGLVVDVQGIVGAPPPIQVALTAAFRLTFL